MAVIWHKICEALNEYLVCVLRVKKLPATLKRERVIKPLRRKKEMKKMDLHCTECGKEYWLKNLLEYQGGGQCKCGYPLSRYMPNVGRPNKYKVGVNTK